MQWVCSQLTGTTCIGKSGEGNKRRWISGFDGLRPVRTIGNEKWMISECRLFPCVLSWSEIAMSSKLVLCRDVNCFKVLFLMSCFCLCSFFFYSLFTHFSASQQSCQLKLIWIWETEEGRSLNQIQSTLQSVRRADSQAQRGLQRAGDREYLKVFLKGPFDVKLPTRTGRELTWQLAINLKTLLFVPA